MLRENARQLLKHGSIYSLGWMFNALAGILLLPVYTRYLSVEDYGAVDLVQQTNMVLRIVFIACFTYSIGRFYYDAKSDEERAVTLSTSALNVIILAAIASSLCLVFRAPISQVIFGDAKYIPLVTVGAGIIFFDMSFTGLTHQYLVRKKSRTFVVINFFKLCTAIVTNLICIVWLGLGAIGMLYGNLMSLLAVSVFAFASCMRANGYVISRELTWSMIKFGSPMIPAGLLATMLHNADRFLLRPLGSLEQVGIFMMGLQFPGMLNSIMMTSFGAIWGGAMMFQIAKQADGDYQIGRIATYCMTGVLLLQTILGIFAGTVLMLLADPKFSSSAKVIPIVCIGYGFHAFYMFMVSKAFTDGNPRRMVAAYAVPVVAKCVLSFLLVPSFGYMASAWIMSASYAIFAGTCYILFRGVNTAKFEYGRLGFLFVTCIVTLFIAHLFHFDSQLQDFFARSALVALLVCFLWIGPYLSRSERQAIITELTRILDRFRAKPAVKET